MTRKFDLRQSSFAGGVIGDHAHGRTDLAKYQVGIRTGNNVIALAHGPLINRPGTEFLMHSRYANWPYAQTDPDEDELSRVKLIPFEYAEDDTYMLGFGHKHMRVFRNGAPVLESTYFGIDDVTQATPGVLTTSAAHGWKHMDLVYINDVGGMVELNDRYWYVKTHQDIGYPTAVSNANPAVVTQAGHGYSTGNYVYLDDIDGDTTNIVSKKRWQITWLSSSTYSLTGCDTSSWVAPAGAGGWAMREVPTPYGADEFGLMDLWGNDLNTSLLTAYTSGGNVYRVTELRRHRMLEEVDIEYTLEHVQRLHRAQSAAVMPIAHRSYAPRELKRIDHDDWEFAKVSFEAKIATPTGLNVDAQPSAGDDVTWYVTAIAEDTSEESVPAEITSKSPEGSGGVTISWNAVTGAKYYNVYRTDDTFRRAGFVGLVESATPSFVDPGAGEVVEPDFTIGPPFPQNPFAVNGVSTDGATSNPGVVTFYEQRLHWASSLAKPQQVWSSVAGVYYNMNESVPVYPDDAFSWIIASEQENEIENLIALDALVVATTARQHKVTGANGGPLTAEPGGVEPRPGGKYGSSWLQALLVGDGALYVTNSGPKVRDAAYDFTSNSYKGGEISILASHFFEGYSIVDWAYADSPWSTVWMARSDGKVICMTFHDEHEVQAWTLHDFGGKVESVAAVREGKQDYLYLLVRREIDGNVVRYYERMRSRDFRNYDKQWDVRNAYFVDCGVSYDEPHPTEPQAEDATYYVDKVNGRFYLDNSDGTFSADSGTWPSAPNKDGDYVDLDDFLGDGVTDVNGYQFYVTAATATYIEITLLEDWDTYTDIDSTYMAAWDVTRYGSVRKAVTGFTSNLWHLEGETVAILANGSVGEPQVVTNGALTLPEDVSPSSRVHIGRPIPDVDIEFLNAESPDPTDPIGHLPQSLTAAHLLVRDSRGISWGPDADNLSPRGERTDERYTEPIRPKTGIMTTRNLPLTGQFDHSRLYIRQPNPLPLEIQAVVRGIELDSPD